MASEIEINQLCRLCLVKEQVNVPIFEEEGDLGQIFLKISACLPVKISRDDSLPKKICDSCSCKLDVVYQFWNTSANSEKQLLKWLNQLGVVNTMTSVNKKNSDSQMAHSINTDTVINLKQEVVELAEHEDDDNMTTEEMDDSNDSENYMLQQQHIPYENFSFQDGFPNEEPSHAVASSTVTSKTVNTRPKRKRRATTKALQAQLDSDDEDDSLLRGKITKTEEQSDSGEDPEPTAFVGLPSTSTDDQPGPSGINKGNAEAPRPCRRIPTSSEVMKAAVKEIIKGGCKLRTTAKKYNIDKMTLRRYVLKYKQHGDDTKFVPNFKFSQIFTDQEEESLADYLLEASKMNYGLTSKDIRTLAFGYALEHQKKLPANWLKNQAASYDWLRGFMSRNTKLSLRTPEPTRLGRKSTFNEQTVEKFFEIYGEIWDREKLQPRLIYTYDETVLQTAYRPSNMLSQRRVSKELVETVTVCGAVNAIGNSVPPMLIFPREREEEYMTRGAPPCAQVVADPGGSMTVEKFEKYLFHFVKFVRCTPKERVILILDNHTSHISSKVFKFCKSNGIILFTIPPHTSHRLLPLQISVFRPFKTFFAHACHNFMMNHPGETVTLKNITPLINEAFLKAFRALFICQGFKRTGLYPFDPYIFTEYDFLSETFINLPEVLREDTPESEVIDAIAEPSELDSKPSSPTDIIPFTKSENGGMQLVKSEIWTDTFNFEEIKEEMI